MRPITVWTEEELMLFLCGGRYSGDGEFRKPQTAEMIAELLRRGRERCAMECEAVMRLELADPQTAGTRAPLVAATCATRIRGLQ